MEQMIDVVEDREVWRFNPELLPPPPTLAEKRAIKKENLNAVNHKRRR